MGYFALFLATIKDFLPIPKLNGKETETKWELKLNYTYKQKKT